MAQSPVAQIPGRETRGHYLTLRVAALCGALAVVIGFAGSAVADVTSEGINPTSPGGDLISTYVQYFHRLQIGAFLSLLAFALQLVFLGPLWTRVQAGSERLAVVAVLGGVSSAATLWMLSAVLDTAMATASHFRDPAAARILLLTGWDTARVATAPNAVMIGACAIAGSRYGVLPRWLTVFSFVLLVLSVGGMIPSGPAGGAGLLGGLWILVVSVYLTFAHAPEPKPGD